MQIATDLIQHIAKLARIRLSVDEAEKFTAQMADIVQYVEKLNEVDTTGVPETNQVTGLSGVSRSDVVVDFPAKKELVATSNNPVVDNQIKVKKSI